MRSQTRSLALSADNLVRNGSFSGGRDGWTSFGEGISWKPNGTRATLTLNARPNGNRAARGIFYPLPTRILKGHTLFLRFAARTSTQGSERMRVELRSAENSSLRLLDRFVRPGAEETVYTFAARADQTFPAGHLQLALTFEDGAGHFDLGQMQLFDQGDIAPEELLAALDKSAGQSAAKNFQTVSWAQSSKNLIRAEEDSWQKRAQNGAQVTTEMGDGGLRLRSNRSGNAGEMDALLMQTLPSSFRAGDRVRVRLLVTGNGELGCGLLESVQASEPLQTRTARLSSTPQEVSFETTVRADAARDSLALAMWFKSFAGWVDIGGASVEKTYEAPATAVAKIAPSATPRVSAPATPRVSVRPEPLTKDTGKNLIQNGDFSAGDSGWKCQGENARPSLKNGTLRLDVKIKTGDDPAKVSMKTPIPHALKAGDWLTLRFRARGSMPMTARVETSASPQVRKFSRMEVLSNEEREFATQFEVKENFQPGQLELNFLFGHATGFVEISDISLLVAP